MRITHILSKLIQIFVLFRVKSKLSAGISAVGLAGTTLACANIKFGHLP